MGVIHFVSFVIFLLSPLIILIVMKIVSNISLFYSLDYNR